MLNLNAVNRSLQAPLFLWPYNMRLEIRPVNFLWTLSSELGPSYNDTVIW